MDRAVLCDLNNVFARSLSNGASSHLPTWNEQRSVRARGNSLIRFHLINIFLDLEIFFLYSGLVGLRETQLRLVFRVRATLLE